MLHLWSLATWGMDITHDAGKPEWIDAPATEVSIGKHSTSEGHVFDGERWTFWLVSCHVDAEGGITRMRKSALLKSV